MASVSLSLDAASKLDMNVARRDELPRPMKANACRMLYAEGFGVLREVMGACNSGGPATRCVASHLHPAANCEHPC
jgi:hypothetical protein